VRPPGGRPGGPVIVPGSEDRRRPDRRRPPWYPGGGQWGRIPWWYWYQGCPYHHGHGPYRQTRGGYYPWSSPFSSTSYPYGTDAYGGDNWGGEGEFASDPYLYPYDTTGYYAEDMGVYVAPTPYYEADPVQYAYTPADVPPRAAVVRPGRSAPAAIIVPASARMPLYALVAKMDAATDAAKFAGATR
jgi:hypothetical protein